MLIYATVTMTGIQLLFIFCAK